MELARERFELRVGTLVSPAALATFGVAVSPTPVPRDTVYRFRIPADRDLADVIRQLTDSRVQILEIRRCPDPPSGPPPGAPAVPARREPAPPTRGEVLPFRRGGPRAAR
ncbi:hypothetical protein ACI78T_02850 [Blastococcus sp. SYSU D00922]